MRVTLELDSSPPDRPTGWLGIDGQRDSLAFDGWLDLMRVLESLLSAGTAPGDPSRPAPERET